MTYAKGDWRGVRDLLTEIVRTEESDRALEMLGTAAWWIDDAATVLDSRERLFRLRRERGDGPGAARVAIQLAWDYTIFRRDAAVARGWAARARGLLDDAAPFADHVWLALRDATLDGAGSETFAEVRRLAREVGAFDAEMMAVTLEGNAMVAEGRVEEGLARMDEAAVAACAGELKDQLAITFACCQLLGACSRVRDYERASQWCDQIAVLCDRRNIWNVLNISRCLYAPILVGRGRFAEAERILVPSVRSSPHMVPHHLAEALAWLADLRLRQGRVTEALSLLDRAEPEPACRLTRSALALSQRENAVAADHARAFLRQSPEDRFIERVTALELLARAEAGRGNLPEARAALTELEATAEVIRSAPVRAAVLMARAAIHEGEGDTETARPELGDAADLFERGLAPYEASLARIELARLLETLGRAAEALRERARGEQELRKLRSTPGGASPLTPREEEVLRLVAAGLSNGEIASRLVLSIHTVHRHLANVMRKLDASSRTAAVARAGELGLL